MKLKVLPPNSKRKPERILCRSWQIEYHRNTLKISAKASGKTRWFEQNQSEKKTLRNMKTPRDSVNLLLRKTCDNDLDGVITRQKRAATEIQKENQRCAERKEDVVLQSRRKRYDKSNEPEKLNLVFHTSCSFVHGWHLLKLLSRFTKDKLR